MSRAHRGAYVYFTDKETEPHFRSALAGVGRFRWTHCSAIELGPANDLCSGVEGGPHNGNLKAVVTILFCILVVPTINAQTKRVTPAEAKDHVGERATICGKVVSANYSSRSKGQPTFLNLDEPCPEQVFTIFDLGQ
jgi:hypothetical protein